MNIHTSADAIASNSVETSSPIFTDAFLQIDPAEIVRQIEEKGYFACERAVREDAVEQMERDATEHRLSLNHNGIGGVYAERQYYLTHMLAVSKKFFDYCTHPRIFAVAEKYLGEKFRLKALRYYETFGGHHMQWHTDNKTDKGFAHIPGLIFIAYFSDVNDGEFQYVEGSHRWSGDTAYSNYSDEFIENEYGDKVRSFKLPRGSMLIYNTYGIHRAKPVTNTNFVRKSTFFQVDNEIDRSEPILLNSEYLTKVDDLLAMYLGFGKPAGYDVFPNTSLMTLPSSGAVAKALAKWNAFRTAKKAFNMAPASLREKVRAKMKGS